MGARGRGNRRSGPPRLSVALALLVVLAPLSSCGNNGTTGPEPLCGPGDILRVGVVAQGEGASATAETRLQDLQVPALQQLLTSASRCEVALEPVRSPELARRNLEQGRWDLAFLPPGLAAFALAKGHYRSVRPLGRAGEVRGLIVAGPHTGLVRRDQLAGRRLGLLPRGSLLGFYLPLYNLHGLRLAKVVYGLSFEELARALRNGQVEAIAWESRRPLPLAGSRVLVRDGRPLPSGALVLRKDLPEPAVTGFLDQLDQSASQLPAFIGYNASTIPDPQRMMPLQRIVQIVESWSLPANGAPYRVGPPVPTSP